MSVVLQLVTKPERLWLAETVMAEMTAECDRVAPNETGGILLGYWGDTTPEPVITLSVGPGPDAVHERERFVPDHRYQSAEIARLYDSSKRTLNYLGDWHSHPGGGGGLSVLDRRTLRRIARCRTARAAQPVMLIMAGELAWEPTAWIRERSRWWVCFPGWSVRQLPVRVFDNLFQDR